MTFDTAGLTINNVEKSSAVSKGGNSNGSKNERKYSR